jgi:hypothetical protein
VQNIKHNLIRLLFEDSSKHHAIHLDSIRKACESGPAAFLTKFYLEHHSPPEKAVKATTKPLPVANEDNRPVDFDDLEEVEHKELRKDMDGDVSSQATSSLFSSILGMKESKFRAADK